MQGLFSPNGSSAPGAQAANKGEPSAVSTFHCLSIYWSPSGGQAGRNVLVKFRQVGEQAWHEGLPMRYNPVKTAECGGDYRGSIVNLTPNTQYEIALTLEGTKTQASLKAATWSEQFPISQTVKCDSRSQTLVVDKSGTPDGYILYDGTGSTIDCANKSALGISVNASYVILRGFTIKNVSEHGIRILAGHNIVVEDCDISKWGSEQERGFGHEMNACVYSNYKDLRAVVVQRNKFHHPSWDSNSWAEDHYANRKSRHPDGPQTVVFWEPYGNNVIRYNESWSDKDHYYNDVIGGAFNASFRGFPGRDSDIYCNYLANCWDDGIEAEGSGQNVRIWNNYIENTMVIIGNAAVSIGPMYVWRNVSGLSYTPPGSSWDLTHGPFLKMGFANSESWMTGHMYIFNNTIFQPDGQGANAPGGESRVIKHCVMRNNIWNVRPEDKNSISTDKRNVDNDFDYDLLSAEKYPAGSEKHGVKGVPQYVSGAGFVFDTKTGNFQLAPESPGRGSGIAIPNFCEPLNGAAADMGAQQTGEGPMQVGVKAKFNPQSK